MGEFSIGQSPTRLEDQRLLTGQGRFLDDINYDRQLWAVILRSPHAHAKILSIDTSAAQAAPGVHGVFTGADYRADGMGVVPCMGDYSHRNGGKMFIPDRPALAVGKVMHIGYPIALVVADTDTQARDASELIEVDYEVLPAVTSCREAFQDGAPQLYDECPNNESYLYTAGNKDGTDKAFEEADHTVSHHLVINRVTANAMENRGVIGEYSPNDGRYTLRCGFQRPWLFRKSLADQSFKVPESRIRLITDDIGGSYGLRGSIYPEMVLMPWASKHVGRPVKWVADRSESHLSDDDGRDNMVDVSLAFDNDGIFKAIKVRSWGNLGAFPVLSRSEPARGPYRNRHRRVYDSGRLCRNLRHADQHPLHLALSRCRATGSLLHDRTDGGTGSRQAGHGSSRTAAEEHHSRRGHALQDAADLHLRLRRVREEHGHGHGDGRLARFSRTAHGVRSTWQAARHRHVEHRWNGRRITPQRRLSSASIQPAI